MLQVFSVLALCLANARVRTMTRQNDGFVLQ